MMSNGALVAYNTIACKEIKRVIRIWVQTLLPPAIGMFLYFVIFGNLIGSRIGNMGEYSYIDYITPGIIIMSVINNSFGNVVSSFFGAKFQCHIEELLVAPVPNSVILLGFVSGGVARAMLVAMIVTATAAFFTDLHVHNWLLLILVLFLTAVAFSIAGLINGIFSKKFDDVSIIPTFILTPLTYLGGVFYTIDLLPEFWRNVSTLNPMLYMVSAFRYSMLGTSDIPVVHAMGLLILFVIILFITAIQLLNRGVGIKK